MERSKKKWVNRDVGKLLDSVIVAGAHSVEYIDCSASVKTKRYQNWLHMKMLEYMDSQ